MKNKILVYIFCSMVALVTGFTGCKKNSAAEPSAVGHWALVDISKTTINAGVGGMTPYRDTTSTTYNNTTGMLTSSLNGVVSNTYNIRVLVDINSNGSAIITQFTNNGGRISTFTGTWGYLSAASLKDAILFGSIDNSIMDVGGHSDGIFRLSNLTEQGMTLSYTDGSSSTGPNSSHSETDVFTFTR